MLDVIVHCEVILSQPALMSLEPQTTAEWEGKCVSKTRNKEMGKNCNYIILAKTILDAKSERTQITVIKALTFGDE